jgi:hypothetical protein
MFTLEGRLEKWLAWTKTYNWSSFGSDLTSKSDEISQGFKHAKLHQNFDPKNCLKLYQGLFETLSNCLKLYLYVYLTLSPPAVKMEWLSQCQAFQRFVRSSHTLVSWTFDLLNPFSISLACVWKYWMLFASVCNINTPGQWNESLGQTSHSLCSSFSGCTNATSALSLGVA